MFSFFLQSKHCVCSSNPKSAEAPSEANASGCVDQGQSQIPHPNRSPLREGFMPPPCPSRALVPRYLGCQNFAKPMEKTIFSPSGHPRDHHAIREPTKILPRGPKTASRGPKKAPRPAKMLIFVRNFDFAKIIEKPKENQCFQLPQPLQNLPKTPQDHPKTLPSHPKPPPSNDYGRI